VKRHDEEDRQKKRKKGKTPYVTHVIGIANESLICSLTVICLIFKIYQ